MTKFILISITCISLSTQAAIVTNINQSAPGATVGGNVDLTSGSFISWGYDIDGLTNGFSNVQSGDTAATFTTGDTINSQTDTNYGWTFTFNDGTTPTSGTSVAASGGMNGIADGESWDLTFSGIVSSTETRRLTLYLGSSVDLGGTDSIRETITPTLTGGSLDEVGSTETYYAEESGTLDNTTNIGGSGYISSIYTIDFTSSTETDLVLNFLASDRGATAATAVSGYTLSVIPEPSSIALLGIAGLALVATRFRKK